MSVPADYMGPITLQAFGDSLISGEFLPTSAGDAAWLRVGEKRIPTLEIAQPAPAITMRSNDWQYLRIDGATTAHPILKSARRHILLAEPDLVVILDELVLTNSSAVEVQLPSRKLLQHDSVHDEWTLSSERARVVVRLLSLPQSTQSWHSHATSSTGRGMTNSGPGAVRSIVADSGAEFQHLSIFSVHTNQVRPSLAFKLLESDTAIGARVHRDGLPTLVAFRKASCLGEANLTGLKFTAPVAVDVFRPKPRSQRSR